MHFDKYSNTLNSHIKIIITKIRSLNHEVKSIILYGGYGRNEGGWYFEKSGSLRPYNDYDILLVLRDKFPQKTINRLRTEIAQTIGIRWVDIDQYSPEELLQLKPSIYNFDLKYSSNVIDGDEKVLNNIPDMEASELGLIEGEILFYTRLWTLLGSLDVNGLKVEKKEEDSRFFRNQMAKALLAVVDVLLLQKASYHPSFQKRVRLLSELYPEKKSLCQLSQWALDEKLFPKAPNMAGEEVQKLYNKVHKHFFTEMYMALGKYYMKPVRGAYDIESHICCSFKGFFKKLLTLTFKVQPYTLGIELSKSLESLSVDHTFSSRIFKKNRILAIRLAQVYIASAYEDMNINNFLLNRGIKWMKCIDRTIPLNLSWDKARINVARMRMEIQ